MRPRLYGKTSAYFLFFLSSMSDATKGNVHVPLVVGPGARSRRKSISGYKYLFMTSILTTLLFFDLYLATQATIFTGVTEPHRPYITAVSFGDIGRAHVVQPLTGREQTFDMAASVWARTADPDGRRTQTRGGDKSVVETVLFSDNVFRDKNLFATVNFTVPTAFF
ncbi:hypothetical protein Hypma_011100 [Hypsizygus marmoreus]|uniref:Uncharacterized protein n=1 Tax=Hypsizygus marmoreus TaxID=39966 RepID=A0A369JIR7_HYPMA|nr:hypothetical protein Hypma_011100 [Hypsizygus marmoreus]